MVVKGNCVTSQILSCLAIRVQLCMTYVALMLHEELCALVLKSQVVEFLSIWSFYHICTTEYTMNLRFNIYKAELALLPATDALCRGVNTRTPLSPFCLKQGAEWLPAFS